LAKRRNFTAKSPLIYEWYQEYYVGAAHGLAGIYYYLMQVRGTGREESLPAVSHFFKQGGAFELALGDIKLGKLSCLMDLLLGLSMHPHF